MSCGELLVVGVVALVVLGPKELQQCAFYCAKAWKAFQSMKTVVYNEITKVEQSDKPDLHG